jgi:hypothetical protein
MKQVKLLFFILFAATTVLSSCMKDRENIYDGPSVVEFVPLTASIKKGTTATPGTATAVVQLVGPQVSTPTELSYSIATTSTGVNGTDYTIAGTAGKVTIPANSSSANIVITALPATFPATGSKTVVLNLLGNDSFKPSENYKTYTLTITQ